MGLLLVTLGTMLFSVGFGCCVVTRRVILGCMILVGSMGCFGSSQLVLLVTVVLIFSFLLLLLNGFLAFRTCVFGRGLVC